MTEFEQRKKNLTEALNKPVKIINDIEKTEEKLKEHIGFKEQKDSFRSNVKAYMMAQGNF